MALGVSTDPHTLHMESETRAATFPGWLFTGGSADYIVGLQAHLKWYAQKIVLINNKGINIVGAQVLLRAGDR